jgi:(2Fe-2S) ferredoxin
MKKMLKEQGLRGTVRANQAGCLDACEHGPVVVVYPEAVWYGKVTPADIPEIIENHIKNNQPVERLLIADPEYR